MDTATTIVIPVYNEWENVLKTLAELDAKVSVPSETWLVYDRDDDTTLAPARTLLGKTRIPFALVKNRYGRGALNAIKTGLEDAKTQLVVVTMADLCDPPEVINDLVATAERDKADIVCASRYMRGGRQYGGPKFKGFLSHTAGLLLCWPKDPNGLRSAMPEIDGMKLEKCRAAGVYDPQWALKPGETPPEKPLGWLR